jgi:hypothetical protein
MQTGIAFVSRCYRSVPTQRERRGFERHGVESRTRPISILRPGYVFLQKRIALGPLIASADPAAGEAPLCVHACGDNTGLEFDRGSGVD